VRVARHLLAVLALLAATSSPAAGGGAVATEHQLAAEAGAELLRAGGSVGDAAIAAGAAICVVHPSSCGIGGGGFALVWRPDGGALALDYRERAPAAATTALYLQDGKPVPERTRRGGLAVGVPGEVRGWTALHARTGRLPLAKVLAPAIRLARDGFPLSASPHLRAAIERTAPLLAADAGLRAVFLGPDGAVPGPDFVVRQPDLARTLEAIGAHGEAAFYAGTTAEAIAKTIRDAGGVMTVADLAAYSPRWRQPLYGTFMGRDVVTFPPPGSGGVVLEILGMLAAAPLGEPGWDSASWLHLLAGCMAQGFADRARWYGDVAVPTDRLLAPPRLAWLRGRLRDDRVVRPDVALDPDAGTAHVSVVDDAGNAVSMTTTINTPFGAGLMVPGTGIALNNEMDDFAVTPDASNAYGLTGLSANAIAPGKRPQSSMSPTILLDGKRPAVVVGGSGGPTIITGVVQVVLGVTLFGRDLDAAVSAPRIHDQGEPPRLAMEPGFSPATRAGLIERGNLVTEVPSFGAVIATGLDASGTPVAAGDGRKDGGAVVVR
jgi:gamma-glutamyltranspeptidase/glutathione hydrolase